MKRYKLLKDLPTFNRGDIFYVSPAGSLVREKDAATAYMASVLEKFKILDSGWFEEIPEYERWRAEPGGNYWCVDDDYLESVEVREAGWDIDTARYAAGNYFKTCDEARKAANWIKSFAVLRDDAKGFKPDWGDVEQVKWCVYYDHDGDELSIDVWHTCQDSILSFATGADAKASIKNHRQEWLTFFGMEE